MGRDATDGNGTAGGRNVSGNRGGNPLGPTGRVETAAADFLSGLGASAAGRETFDRRLAEAMAANETGWIGLRIKLINGAVRAVQFTIDQQFPVDGETI